MCLYRIPGIPVVEDEDRLVGIIAEKDVLHCLFPKLESLMAEGMGNVDLDNEMGRYKDVLALSGSELMTRSPVTVAPDMHILRAATMMVRHRFRRSPVAEDGRLLGMLSLGDVHKAIFHTPRSPTSSSLTKAERRRKSPLAPGGGQDWRGEAAGR
jgi:CBS domain-containing protein